MRSKVLRVATWATAAVLGAGLISGVSWAVAASGSSSSSTTAASTGAAYTSAASSSRSHHRATLGVLRHLEHGQFTTRVHGADATYAVQEGVVTAISPNSITVRSRDGYTSSYAIASTTRIRADKATASSAAVHDGNRVLVLAKGGTATQVHDPRPSVTASTTS